MTQQPSKRARPSPTIRVGVLGLFAAFLLVLPLALAPRAEAFIYWIDWRLGAIGRANLDGTGVDESFIIGDTSRRRASRSTRDHIYWTNRRHHARSAAPTSTARTSTTRFITPSPPGAAAEAVSRSTPNHIYWTSTWWRPRSASSGRRSPAPTSTGPGSRRRFITGLEGQVTDVAVDANHLYWAQDQASDPDPADRRPRSPPSAAPTSMGPGVERSFIPVPCAGYPPHGVVAVDAEPYLLATNPPRMLPEADRPRQPRRHRASIERFIDDFDFHRRPIELAVDAEHIYWVDRRCVSRR